jgi:multiple sugar transport system substrate-binding protein
MKRFKLVSIALCVLLVLTTLLAGCGGAANSPSTQTTAGSSTQANTTDKTAEAQVTLNFWKAPHSDKEAENWKPLLDKFTVENPNIKVDLLVTPWDTWNEKYTAAFASGNPPDVAYMTEWYPQFAAANQLHDLSSYITDEMKARYGKGSWDYGTYNGKVIGVPYIVGDTIVYYNKDIFTKENLTVPKTWDEFLKVAKAATKDTNGDGKIDQWGTTFTFLPGVNIHQFLFFVYQAGATYLSADQKELGFANPDGIKAIKFVTDLLVKEKVAPAIDTANQQQSDDMFYKGQIAMRIDQNSFEGTIKQNAPNLNVGAFMVPAGPSTDPLLAQATQGGMGLLSMSEASKNKDAAWKFIDFQTKPENESMF